MNLSAVCVKSALACRNGSEQFKEQTKTYIRKILITVHVEICKYAYVSTDSSFQIWKAGALMLLSSSGQADLPPGGAGTTMAAPKTYRLFSWQNFC
jgi:hypothetical protein